MTGAVLAGGHGRRMGGAKPSAELGGRPLIAWPLAALAQVCDRIAVVCKPGTDLPPLPEGVERWEEAEGRRHPLVGIVHAIERAGGEVLVCAGDMPYVTPEACRTLQAAAEKTPGIVAVVARGGGRLQPLLGIYGQEALEPLHRTAPDAPLTRAVEALDPLPVDLPADLTLSVNTPAELAEASRLLRSA